MFGKKKTEAVLPREDGLTDYDQYFMGKRERALTIVFAMAVLAAIGYVFYHSLIMCALLSLFGFRFPKIRTAQIIDRRKRMLTLQFKDMLYSLSSALSVGKSVETGIRDSLKDLAVIYPDPETDIITELEYILRGLGMNRTVEEMFGQFAERAHIEDIDNFVDVFVTCKRTGGDLMETMRSTSSAIGEKIETKQEIETMISGKKFEFQILMVLPVVMVVFLTATSGDYMAPVFTEWAGRLAMTVAILFFGAAYVVGSKIMKISV